MTNAVDKYTFESRPSRRIIEIITPLGATMARNMAMNELTDDPLQPDFMLLFLKHEVTLRNEKDIENE